MPGGRKKDAKKRRDKVKLRKNNARENVDVLEKHFQEYLNQQARGYESLTEEYAAIIGQKPMAGSAHSTGIPGVNHGMVNITYGIINNIKKIKGWEKDPGLRRKLDYYDWLIDENNVFSLTNRFNELLYYFKIADVGPLSQYPVVFKRKKIELVNEEGLYRHNKTKHVAGVCYSKARELQQLTQARAELLEMNGKNSQAARDSSAYFAKEAKKWLKEKNKHK